MFLSPKDLDTIKNINMRSPSVWFATWFGAGFLRPAPGTWGSAFSIPPLIILYLGAGLVPFIIALCVLFIAGLWSAEEFDKATGGHDNKMIVIDEAVGQGIALLPALLLTDLDPIAVFLGFILFRFFDITKLWPIGWLDKNLPGAWGVMMDDVLAGLFAAAILTGVIYYAGLG